MFVFLEVCLFELIFMILILGEIILVQFECVWCEGLVVQLDDSVCFGIVVFVVCIVVVVNGDVLVYGVNIGFGKLVLIKIVVKDIVML